MLKPLPWAVGLILVGLALFLASLAWPALVKPQDVWSPEQGAEQASASTELHQRTHEAAHAEISTMTEAKKAEARQRLEESKVRFQRSRAALDEAKQKRDRVPRWLRGAGVVMMLAGVGLYLSAQAKSESKDRRRRG